MKTLEKIKDMIDFCDAIGCHRALYESLKAVEAELEALQQPKSCNTCRYYTSTLCPVEEFSITSAELEKHPFYCNRHEPKEQ